VSSKKYYKYMDLIRLISCIAVLLYHFNILKGGYLAVCIFFVLSGYLSCISNYKKEKFSLISYYYNRFKKIYIPLLIVVFITISIVSLLPDILWLNLKVETTSVLFGYNNFWQLSANLDYFARHVNSPFMHLWYIGILLQYDLIFPLIFIPLKKIGDKIHKIIPCIITILLSLIACIYFYKSSLTQNIMVTYYDTFSRIFSLLLGLSLGFIHSYYSFLFEKRKTILPKILFSFLIILLIILFIFVDASSKYLAITMIGTSLISCFLIMLSIQLINNNKLNFLEKIIKSLSSISYEIYLVQYPVIFFFQNIDLNVNNTIKILLMISIIFLISFIIHTSLNLKNMKYKFFKILLLVILFFISIFGCYKYIVSKDYTKDMKLLEEQLLENEKLFLNKQKEFEEQKKLNEDELLERLKDVENSRQQLESVITKLNVVGIGDSVMLGALNNLYEVFPNGYFDAKKSRTDWVVPGILTELKNKNLLGNVLIINMGANGDAPDYIKDKIMHLAKDCEVFWVNIPNNQNKNFNIKLTKLKETYDNLHIIDWDNVSVNHPEYFIADKIHLSNDGKKAYSNYIYQSIYQFYENKYIKRKEELLQNYENNIKSKISFYGDNILINAFNHLQNEFSNDRFYIDNNYSFESLKEKIKDSIKNKSVTNKIVFAFSNNLNIGETEYLELINLLKDSQIYILSTEKDNLLTLKEYSNVSIISFNQIDTKYFMPDKIHLNDEGNIFLVNTLKEYIK